MLPRKRRENVVSKRQGPLLHTHRALKSKVLAKRSTLADDWSSLPVLVLIQLFVYLRSTADRRSVRLVCRHWSKSMNNPHLWKASKLHLPYASRLHAENWNLLKTRRILKLSLGPLSPSALLRILKKISHTLPDLRCLCLEFKKFKRQFCYDFHGLSQLSNLRELSLSGSQVAVAVPGLPTLNKLAVPSRLEIKFDDVFEELETLSLTVGCGDTLELDIFPHLRSLSLTKSSLDRDTFTRERGERPRFSHIKCLDVSYSRLSLGVESFFNRFPNLLRLDVSHCGLSEWDLLRVVEILTELTELNLTGNEVTDAVLSAITSPLTKLTVQRSTAVTSRGLEGLAESSGRSLVSLDLSHCTAVPPSTLTVLETWFPELATLTISGWILAEKVRVKLTHLSFETIT